MIDSAAIKDKPILEDLHRRLHAAFRDEVSDIVYIGRFYEGRNPEKDYCTEFVVVWKGGKIGHEKKRAIQDECFETDIQFDNVSWTHIISEEELSGPRGQQFPYDEMNEIGMRVV